MQQETIILNTLQWKLAPITANAWLNVYLQAAHMSLSKDPAQTFVLPQYSQNSFVHVAQVTISHASETLLRNLICLIFS